MVAGVAIGVDLTDHRNYRAASCHALLVTDTAFLRNPDFHTGQDLPTTLDCPKMAAVVDGVAAAVVDLAREGVPSPR